MFKGFQYTECAKFDTYCQYQSLFELPHSQEDSLYTYTIITLEAHPDFAHIHDRMPAILAEDVDIERWLDPSIETEELVSMLQPSSLLAWYPVSTAVNNVRHKTTECVERIDPK